VTRVVTSGWGRDLGTPGRGVQSVLSEDSMRVQCAHSARGAGRGALVSAPHTPLPTLLCRPEQGSALQQVRVVRLALPCTGKGCHASVPGAACRAGIAFVRIANLDAALQDRFWVIKDSDAP
jgi:hypothetical protein